jgi:hypothetical protein
MTAEQLGILNSLVTFAAEHIPGGLSKEEREVAQLVGSQALFAEPQTHTYKTVNASHYKSVTAAANFYATMGWRVVGVIGSCGPGYADQLVLERPLGISHPDD